MTSGLNSINYDEKFMGGIAVIKFAYIGGIISKYNSGLAIKYLMKCHHLEQDPKLLKEITNSAPFKKFWKDFVVFVPKNNIFEQDIDDTVSDFDLEKTDPKVIGILGA